MATVTLGASVCAMSPSVEGFARIGTPPGKVNYPLSTDTEPLGINGSGQIVGSYYAADGTPHGFLLAAGT